MLNNLDMFLKLSNDRHDALVSNKDSKVVNSILKKMDFSEKDLPNEIIVEVLNTKILYDWQIVDLAAKLAIKRNKKEIGKEFLNKMLDSKDKFSSIYAKIYLKEIIPQLEKEGKI